MNNNHKTELTVSAIENGTVIDHIPVESLFKVVKFLNIENLPDQVTIGFNFTSKKYGSKGIIKIANKFFADDDLNKIALVAPTATIITIKNFNIIEKKQVTTPKKVGNIIKCINPKCITNNQEVDCSFDVIENQGGDIKLKCHYCEKFTTKDNFEFK